MPAAIPVRTVDDLERIPEDGNRYELLDGVVLVTPAPSVGHQIVVSRIQAQLIAALQLPGFAHVVSPGAIAAPPRTQLQPDLLVFPARFGPRADWGSVTEHWLAVEVLSRSSRLYDCEFKRAAYFALGVPQVWLVDPWDRRVEVWSSRRARLVETHAMRWRVPAIERDVSLDLGAVFADFA